MAMMMEGLVLICFSLCLLLLVPETIQFPLTNRKAQDSGAILNRLTNLETLFIEERLKTVSIHNDLAEIKSRLDALSVQRPAYDDEFIKSFVSEILTNTLDTIQGGLVSEKQQRLRLENMAIEAKDIVNKQNDNHKLLEKKTNQLENKIVDIVADQNNSQQLLKEKTKMLEKQIKALEHSLSAVSTIDQTKSTVRSAMPTAQPPFNPHNLNTGATTTNPSGGNKIVATSPGPPIVGRVKFSGKPGNQFDNRKAKDCKQIEEFGYSKVAVYLVYIKPDSPVLVVCRRSQMMIQRHLSRRGWREQLEQDFNKTWEEYKYGFGSYDSDFWIGTEILWQAMNTSSGSRILEIGMRSKGTGAWQWIRTSNTQLTNEREGYQLHYSGYITSPDFHFEDQIPGNGYTFMTRDRQSRGSNCPDIDGGWWYQRSPGCNVTPSNPNSKFINVTHSSHQIQLQGYYSHQPSLRTNVTGNKVPIPVVQTNIALFYRNRN